MWTMINDNVAPFQMNLFDTKMRVDSPLRQRKVILLSEYVRVVINYKMTSWKFTRR